ncbi:triple functional domain protein isoform X4 [Eurytemora carolleeae]|uniref:triple functional domain protein isoform X4 n=1 Tax=Eurytemora carolleeae TaxID=1294199 RepID=UPI000C78E0DA|nr:triple functional domain protein isoform X4 [Eurytemora carolleeae]|eukprot:XP_023330642.1 triple functional domain protein-like isoform X4 [Eurytemora affinis]
MSHPDRDKPHPGHPHLHPGARAYPGPYQHQHGPGVASPPHGAIGGQSHGLHGPLAHRGGPGGGKEEGKFLLSGARRVDGLRCLDVMKEMEEGLALLTGGRDRRGGPVLTLPQNPRRERARPEDYKKLLDYLLGVPCDDVREMGFTVVIDMRGNSSWTTVKPILKVLQDNYSTSIHTALIIKPDTFWQKQRTNLGSQKYKFETHLIGLESLHKQVDPSQLTVDLEGTLSYDHTIWIEMRCGLEDFVWQSSELLDRMEDMREDLNHNDFADDVNGAKKSMDLHNESKKKIHKVPVENIDGMGQRLLQRLSTCEGGNSYDSGYCGRDSTASNMTLNPDLQVAIPQIMQLLDQVHSGQQQLLQLWKVKRNKLDHCLQLRMFEQDCEKMFDWIFSNRDVFLGNYVEIGRNYQDAKTIQEEHNQFTAASNNVYVNISRILTAAGKLIEGGHYAAVHVRDVASRLDSTWKGFAGGLDERTTVLALSVLFHQKAETYVENVSGWSGGCEVQGVSSDITVLETSIHHHQALYEAMCQAYTEVHSTSKKLLYQLDHLVQVSAQTVQESPQKKHSSGCPQKRKEPRPPPKSTDPAADYQEGAGHVLSVIHEILAHHRQLEAKWHQKKIKLHQRLALRLFQEDVKQVLDWLEKHGEVFLRKNVGIGRNLQKSRVYQKSHETFEGVVQNTYTNAEKLLAAAEELAQTGECNAEDIYSVARELENHIASFAARVEGRRHILDSAVLFYSHVEELGSWLAELKGELASEEVAETAENAERLLDQFSTQRESTLDALQSTIQEGESLLRELGEQGIDQEMDSTGSVASVQSTLTRLSGEREELGELWTTRKLRLDLCLQLRLFERDALELSAQFEVWGEELHTGPLPRNSVEDAERASRQLDDQISHIQSATYSVVQRGQDLLQLFESSGINLMADSQYNGETRVQVLLEYLQERGVDMEELAAVRRLKLEQCVSLTTYQSDASQVMRWIQTTESMLMASFSIPGSLHDAELLKKEHEQFQVAIEKTHSSAVHVRQRAETLLQLNHFDPAGVKEIADSVTNRWQNLVTRAEERHKLVTASLNFYKTAEQVCSVLDSLEREYKREDDWLARHTSGDHDRATLIAQLINKHQEQKEAFLKACTLARRTAETFLKYSNRSLQYFNHPNHPEYRGPELKVKNILEKLLTQENRVLEYWTNKKKRLDQNQQYVLFERSARQSLAWIKEEGDIYLSTHTQVGKNKEETEVLLQEHNSFKEKARETREKVKLLLQLADTLVEKGHAHAPNIKQWVEEVDETYKNFSSRMDQYREKLEASLGLSVGVGLMLEKDTGSDPALESRFKDGVADLKQIKELNEEKRRSARRKEFIMAELLETERSYVKDLELAVNSFLIPMRTGVGGEVPASLRGKEAAIFGNLEDICSFHRGTFLKELEKYEMMPEDVGHCFVTWASNFSVYVRYCTNKPKSTELLVQHGVPYFEHLQHLAKLEQPIAAYLIKPVQRITKYQLLLKDLLSCSTEAEYGEIKDGLDVCLSVPRRANDALHLSLLDGCDISLEHLGEVILQDVFHVWDQKKLIRQSRERRMFLFDLYLVFSKEVKDSSGKAKYMYKMKMMTSDIGITEHVEGDECKFAVWTGRTPASESKVILKASSMDVKQLWVRKMRQLIQETYFGSNSGPPGISSLAVPTSSRGHKHTTSQRSSRDLEETRSLDESIENMERGSLASFGSGGTTDSETKQDKALCGELTLVIADHTGVEGHLSVRSGQQVEVLDLTSPDLALVRLSSSLAEESRPEPIEGLLPLSCLKLSPTKYNQFRTEQSESLDALGATSPINKRKVFSGKWLPNIRKLSQARLEKSHSLGGHDGTIIQRQISKSKFKFGQTSVDMGNRVSGGGEQEPRGPSSTRSRGRSESGAEAPEEEPEVEVPPPMRPISSMPSTEEPLKESGISVNGNGVESCKEVSTQPNEVEERLAEEDGSVEDEVAARALEQRGWRVRELVESEQDYVSDLAQCAQYIYYMRESKDEENPEIPMPEDLKQGKDRMIFGNLEMIYEWHRDYFSKNVCGCADNPSELGNLFKKCERKFQMYVVYCQNKPKSEFIVSEYIDTYFEEIRLKYGFKLRLTDLLIKPIQRLTKYHMLLEAILKHSQRANLTLEAKALEQAFKVMTVVPNQANDMMDIGRLQGFEGKIVAQGKLLLRGPLLCTDDPSSSPNHRFREMTVFLFEQIIIFAETVGKKTQFTSPVYTYKAHFQVNKMQLDEKVDNDTEKRMFKVKSTDPTRPGLVYLCQADDLETRDRWVNCIRRQLQTQLDFLKALQAPIAYHNKMSKESGEWEFSINRSLSTSRTESRPKSNPHQESNFLSIEEAFDKAMSLPSSPVRKEPAENFDALDQLSRLVGKTTRQAVQIKKTTVAKKEQPRQVENGLVGFLSPGSCVPVLLDYRPIREDEISVNKGELVTIISSNLSRGYLVNKPPSASSLEEMKGWLPSYTLHPANQETRKQSSWGFRVRKQSFTRDKHCRDSCTIVHVLQGSKGVLQAQCKDREKPVWRSPTGSVISTGGRFRVEIGSGSSRLNIEDCDISDSGEYSCVLEHETLKILLQVSRIPPPPTQPRVQDLKGTSALLSWDTGDISQRAFRLEWCEVSVGQWKVVKDNLTEGVCLVDNLVQGETYSFRLISYSLDCSSPDSEPSLPCPPLTVPLGEGQTGSALLALQQRKVDTDPALQTNFEQQYIELEEVGRGRFSVVRRCQEILTGREVAVKFLNRRRRTREQTRREHNILARVRHTNIVAVAGIFATPSSDAIVMELVSGFPLLVWLCESPSYSESSLCGFTVQLLSALSFLHTSSIVHADIRPENLLLESDNRTLKLLDFGESRVLSRGGDQDLTGFEPEISDLEFQAPELVSGGPLGTYTDMWAFGVLLYVLLSGMSPFLDDSQEETRNNILRCDFSFPDDSCCSSQGRELVSRLLISNPSQRISAPSCLTSSWLRCSPATLISSRLLSNFNTRRRRITNPGIQKISR